MRIGWSLGALAVLLGACAASGAQSHDAADRLFAPRHALTGADGFPTGDIEGTLDVRNGCLVLVTPTGEVNLALWPASARIASVDGAVTVLDAGAPARLGDRIHVGGGQYGPVHRAFVEELIGEPVHPACNVDGYWLVSEVVTD